MNTQLQELIKKIVQTTPHCSRHHVELAFRADVDPEDGYGWTCRIESALDRIRRAGSRRPQTLRLRMEGFGKTPEAAVADVLEQVEVFKDPEAAEKKRALARTIRVFEDMRDAGGITDEQFDKLVTNVKRAT